MSYKNYCSPLSKLSMFLKREGMKEPRKTQENFWSFAVMQGLRRKFGGENKLVLEVKEKFREIQHDFMLQ